MPFTTQRQKLHGSACPPAVCAPPAIPPRQASGVSLSALRQMLPWEGLWPLPPAGHLRRAKLRWTFARFVNFFEFPEAWKALLIGDYEDVIAADFPGHPTHLLYTRLLCKSLLAERGLPFPWATLRSPAHRARHEALWQVLVARNPRLHRRRWAAAAIQAAWRQHRQDRSARRLQLGCRRWLWLPTTRDGRLGIHLRLLLRDASSMGLLAA